MTLGCAGDDERTFHIGVMVDCRDVPRPLRLADWLVPSCRSSGGGDTGGPTADGGVSSTPAAGRPVELIRGCAEGVEFLIVIAEVCRLVEQEESTRRRRELARACSSAGGAALCGRRGRPATSGPREATLLRPVPKPLPRREISQAAAGLGTSVTGSSAGGAAVAPTTCWPAGASRHSQRILARSAVASSTVHASPLYDPEGRTMRRRPGRWRGRGAHHAASGRSTCSARGPPGDPPRRLVLGPSALGDTAMRTSRADALRGCGRHGGLFPAAEGARWPRGRAQYGRTFPTPPPAGELSRAWTTKSSRSSARGRSPAAIRGRATSAPSEALGELEVDLASGWVRMSEDRQATIQTPRGLRAERLLRSSA